jgi:hypothetical protein
MRNESGIALITVMGLLVVMSLIGVGLISQTVLNTKLYEALGTSYQGVPAAQQDFVTKANVGTGNLVVGLGKRPSDSTLVTVIYGRKAGQVWKPDLINRPVGDPFYQNWNENGTPPYSSDGSTVTVSYNNTGKKAGSTLDESSFLLKDDTSALQCWTSYSLHVNFIAGPSPSFGVYFNSDTGNKKDITGYLFQISPIDNTFSIAEVHNGKPNPGSSYQSIMFNDSSIKDANGNNPFVNWMNSTSVDTSQPFDPKGHSIDISVQSQGKNSEMTVVVNVDGVQIMTYTDKSLNPNFVPSLIGLSNWSGKGWGTSTVTFSNISVTNATP